jgi:NADH-quinone oxidoreductase subunit C
MDMDGKHSSAVAALQEKFGAEIQEFRGEVTGLVASDLILAAMLMLRDAYGFDQLVDVTAVDYWPQEEPRFHVVYHIRNLEQTSILCLRSPLNGNAPVHPSVEGLYPAANWYEREVYDMFGVTFTGHSDLRRILMPADWEGHPQRKDFPLGYEEVQFSFNFDEVIRRKPHPLE